MGFFLTVLYLVTSYLTPAVLFGPLAQYRIELILAALVLLVSMPKMTRSFAFRTPQALALAGLSVAVFLSMLIAVRWMGGAISAFLGFIPSIYAYFLICLHCNSKRKIRIIVLMLLFVCLFDIANGAADLRHVNAFSGSSGAGPSEGVNRRAWDFEHPYLLQMKNDTGAWFYRIRGSGGNP